MIKKLLFITLLVVISNSWATERSESFLVYATDSMYRVISPAKSSDVLSVIIENKMLTDLLGRLETTEGKLISYVKVKSGKYKSYELKGFNQKSKVQFVPLSPAFQEVVLKIGTKAYEIPPKR